MARMFKRRSTGKIVTITVDGQNIEACTGEPLAAAILTSNIPATRVSIVSGNTRAPYCMMGVCFECLVEVNGLPYQQACMLRIEEGMNVKRHTVLQEAAWS